MFLHKEEKILPYSVEQIYNVVADVEHYPDFIPWVSRVIVLNKNNNIVDYGVHVDFKIIKERFATRDTFYKNEKIEIFLLDHKDYKSPFKFLKNTWYFKKITDNSTLICFEIEFEFKSKILSALFSKIFLLAQNKIIESFQERAKDLYK